MREICGYWVVETLADLTVHQQKRRPCGTGKMQNSYDSYFDAPDEHFDKYMYLFSENPKRYDCKDPGKKPTHNRMP
jgi:hypothetical protein